MDFSLIGRGLLQVEHNARAVTRLHNIDSFHIALIDIENILTGCIGGAWKIKCDARRRLNREPGRQCGQRFRKVNSDNIHTVLHAACNRLNDCLSVAGDGHQNRNRNPAQDSINSGHVDF